jgi:hypothetical protein
MSAKSTIKGEKNYCQLDADSWSWKYAGDRTSIHWNKLCLNDNLTAPSSSGIHLRRPPYRCLWYYIAVYNSKGLTSPKPGICLKSEVLRVISVR